MSGSTGTHARGLEAPARVEGRPGKLAESDSDEFDDVSLSEECSVFLGKSFKRIFIFA